MALREYLFGPVTDLKLWLHAPSETLWLQLAIKQNLHINRINNPITYNISGITGQVGITIQLYTQYNLTKVKTSDLKITFQVTIVKHTKKSINRPISLTFRPLNSFSKFFRVSVSAWVQADFPFSSFFFFSSLPLPSGSGTSHWSLCFN